MALTIKTINCVLFRIIKTLDGKIPGIARHLVADKFTNHLVLHEIPNKVIVSLIVIVEKCNENAFVIYEATGDKRVLKVGNGDRIVIDAKKLIDLKLIFLNLFRRSEFKAKSPNSE